MFYSLYENRTPWLGSHVPPCPLPAAAVVAGPAFAPGGIPAESNRIPISGDHMPGIGTEGGGTAARTGCGAVRGAAVPEGRWECICTETGAGAAAAG